MPITFWIILVIVLIVICFCARARKADECIAYAFMSGFWCALPDICAQRGYANAFLYISPNEQRLLLDGWVRAPKLRAYIVTIADSSADSSAEKINTPLSLVCHRVSCSCVLARIVSNDDTIGTRDIMIEFDFARAQMTWWTSCDREKLFVWEKNSRISAALSEDNE